MSINEGHNVSWHHIPGEVGWVQIKIAKSMAVIKPVARVGYQTAGSRNDRRKPQHCRRQQFAVWHHITHFYPFICPNLRNFNIQHNLHTCAIIMSWITMWHKKIFLLTCTTLTSVSNILDKCEICVKIVSAQNNLGTTFVSWHTNMKHCSLVHEIWYGMNDNQVPQQSIGL